MRASIVLIVFVAGCGGGWSSSSALLADPRRVAEALGDPPPDTDTADLLPELADPGHPRTCCAFGMDLHVDVASIEVPFFTVGNVMGVDDLGAHAYSLPLGVPEVEGNGLVYTCRGGWIDTAHVRENADVQLFLTLALAQHLRDGGTVVIPGHGAPTTIVLSPLGDILGAELLEADPLRIASALASWVTYRMGIFHEISTWYGYQMVAGFSEQPSAFSPEDLYSNALGIRLGRAVIFADRFTSSAVYEETIVAYIRQALVNLEAQPPEAARAIMASLDGRWWDSSLRLPDTHLVMRRGFPAEEASPGRATVTPWLASDAFDADAQPPALAVCAGSEVRTLSLPDHLAGRPISELVHLSFAPEAWAATLPSATPGIVEESELDALVETTRAAMAAVMGTGFDAPRGEIVMPAPRREWCHAPAHDRRCVDPAPDRRVHAEPHVRLAPQVARSRSLDAAREHPRCVHPERAGCGEDRSGAGLGVVGTDRAAALERSRRGAGEGPSSALRGDRLGEPPPAHGRSARAAPRGEGARPPRPSSLAVAL